MHAFVRAKLDPYSHVTMRAGHVPDMCRHVHAVTAQGRTLKVKNTAKRYAWRFDDGAYIQTTWERYKPGLGNTVTIETGESPLTKAPSHLPWVCTRQIPTAAFSLTVPVFPAAKRHGDCVC